MNIQVCNPSDYEGRVLIECDGFEGGFAVPAWDERGLPELEGPFVTVAQAQAALDEHREYLDWRGYQVRA